MPFGNVDPPLPVQRRLADEGFTFDAILDDLRRDLALRYLSDKRIAIAEVAYLLGYSEPSPFHRAFKRWTGSTPNEMRNRAAWSLHALARGSFLFRSCRCASRALSAYVPTVVGSWKRPKKKPADETMR